MKKCKFFKPKMTNKWLFTIAGISGVSNDDLLEWCEEVWSILKFNYTQSHRYYHNFDHIRTLLKMFDKNKNHFNDPIAVELAIWFHDIVYNPVSKFNEDASAEIAHSLIMKLNKPELAETVRQLVMFTKWTSEWFYASTVEEITKHLDKANNDFLLLRDMDWSGLASDSKIYEMNCKNLRAEVSFLNDFEYAKKRLAFLNIITVLPRPLYCTEVFYKFESKATENISKEVEHLKCLMK